MNHSQQIILKVVISILIMLLCAIIFSEIAGSGTFVTLLSAGVAFYSIREVWKADLNNLFKDNDNNNSDNNSTNHDEQK
jgi:hypothetical protein